MPGLDLAAGYLPARDGVHVGGDWYDVFLLCDNRIGLQRTSATLLRVLPEAIASAFYAVLDLATGGVRYASAGDPPPLLITATGDAQYLDDAPGILLDACADISVGTGQRRLAPGTGLLLYTDGLIEDPRRDIDEGLSALAAAVRRSAAGTADQIRAAAESLLHGRAVPRRRRLPARRTAPRPETSDAADQSVRAARSSRSPLAWVRPGAATAKERSFRAGPATIRLNHPLAHSGWLRFSGIRSRRLMLRLIFSGNAGRSSEPGNGYKRGISRVVA